MYMCNKPNNEPERKRRFRVKGKGLAVVTYTPELFWPEGDPSVRREVSRTLGFPEDFGHPDVEVFYKFGEEPYGNFLLSLIHGKVKDGAHFSEGDRLSFKMDSCGNEYTVEFRTVKVNKEELLRAVVLELDREYQAVSTADAVGFVLELYNSEKNLFESLDDCFDFDESEMKS